LTLDRSRGYWNEGVIARFTLYSRIRLEGPVSWDPPDAAGFWSEVMGPARTGRVVVGGVEYDASELRVAYFPTRTGRLSVGPGRVHLRVVRKVVNPDPFSMLGLPEEQVEEMTLQTERVSLEAMPLPPGAPASFKGAVGDFSMDVKVDRVTVRSGEPVTIVTSVRGEGNVASAGDPDVVASVPGRNFAGGANTTLDHSREHLRGERRREVTFIPEAPGRMSILPVRFSWFDPEAKRYRTQISDTIRIFVQSPAVGADSNRANPASAPIAAIRTMPGRKGGLSLEPPPACSVLALASLFAYAGSIVGLGVRRRAERDPRRRRVLALASLGGELHDLHPAGSAGASAASRVAVIVQRALGLRYNVDLDGSSIHEALRHARDAGADAEHLTEVERLLQALDRLAFAPQAPEVPGGFPERDEAKRLLERYREEIA
jgi:hypothetical protein